MCAFEKEEEPFKRSLEDLEQKREDKARNDAEKAEIKAAQDMHDESLRASN